jgi:hypothetical protein
MQQLSSWALSSVMVAGFVSRVTKLLPLYQSYWLCCQSVPSSSKIVILVMVSSAARLVVLAVLLLLVQLNEEFEIWLPCVVVNDGGAECLLGLMLSHLYNSIQGCEIGTLLGSVLHCSNCEFDLLPSGPLHNNYVHSWACFSHGVMEALEQANLVGLETDHHQLD